MKEKSRIIISDSLIADVRSIIEKGRRHAFAVAGQTAIMTYWNVGRRIVEEEQQGNSRAGYGKGLMAKGLFPLSRTNLLLNMAQGMVGVTWRIIVNST